MTSVLENNPRVTFLWLATA